MHLIPIKIQGKYLYHIFPLQVGTVKYVRSQRNLNLSTGLTEKCKSLRNFMVLKRTQNCNIYGDTYADSSF